MFLVSNYPQVPIATTNPATESAEVDAKLRMPVPVAEALEKTGAERAISAEHERAEIRRRQQQQGGEHAATSDDESPDASSVSERPLTWKEKLAEARPVMERPTLRRPGGDDHSVTARAALLKPEEYERFAEIVGSHYANSAQPKGLPGFTAAT